MEEDNGDFFYEEPPRMNDLNHNMGFDPEQILNAGDYNVDQSPSPSSPSVSSEDTESDNDPGSPEYQEIIVPDPDLVMINDAQPEMAARVLDALVHGKNLLIECPPGRERVLTILKRMLHYFQWKKYGMRMDEAENYVGVPATAPKRIYVVTRNFMESKKFLDEMKTKLLVGTGLLSNIQMSVLDHRKNYCVNEDVMRNGTDSASVDHACRKIIRGFNQRTPPSSKRCRDEDELSCEYYRNSRTSPDGAVPFMYPNDHALFRLELNNIEDFIEGGQGIRRCPYYDSMHLAQQADLIFLPADIFLSPYFRQEYSIDLEQAIVFIDDGFDLENLCKEQASVDISLHQLNQACATIRYINEDYQQRVQDDIGIGLIELVNFLPTLSQFVARNEHDARPDPEEVLDVIRGLNIDAVNIPAVTQEILHFAENAPTNIDIEVGIIDKLRNLVTVLGLMSTNNADGKERFRVQVKARESSANRGYEMFLQITCADPCLIMSPIEASVISLIIGSNCIAPYPPFYNEFNGMFTEERTLKIGHDDMMMRRYLIEYTTKGPSGAKFALGFDARDEPMVKKEVLMAILELCKVIPQNVICFFHSRNYLRRVLKFMQNESIAQGGRLIEDEIASQKTIFCETDATNDIEAQELLQNFHGEPGGAVLFALHRGKLCKNYDLEHETVRGIVHVSIPFGPWYHHQDIVAKRKFIGESNNIENLDWYHCEAFRIWNQSFNYCVRKREESDWGVVVVLDSRMHGERHKFDDMVPHWARQGNFPKHRREFSALINSVQTKVRECTARVGN